MQFTRSGHTQLRANAIMITRTITVVLFSTVVRHFLPIFCDCEIALLDLMGSLIINFIFAIHSAALIIFFFLIFILCISFRVQTCLCSQNLIYMNSC
jgi:hypothetical protein